MSSEDLRDAFHYLYKNEVPFLKELANRLPFFPTVVNIGAGAGTSGLALRESRPDLTLITIDITRESSPFGCLAAEKEQLENHGLWDHQVHHIHEDSKVVGAGWQHSKVDMVFIDGDHSYDGCRGDILAWLPHIKEGGILAIHDYKKDELPVDYANSPHPKPWPGVDKAVDVLLLGKYKPAGRVDSLIAFFKEKVSDE